jgi:hypothetical protein
MNSLPSYDSYNNNDNNDDFSHDYMSLYTPMLLAEEEEQQEEVEQNAIPDSNPSSSLSIVATSSTAAAAAAAASVDISTATGCSSSNKKRCILSGLHCTYAAAAATAAATATATATATTAVASPSAAFASRLPPTSVRRAIMFPQQPSCGRPLAIHQEENQNKQKQQIPYNLKPMHLQQLFIQQKQEHFQHQQQQSVQQFLLQHRKQKQKQRLHQQQQQQQHQHHQQMLQQQQQKQAVMQHQLLRQQVMNIYSPQTNKGINSNRYPSHFSTQTTPLLGSTATSTSYVQAGNMIPSNQNRRYSNVNTNQQQQQQQKRKEYSSSEDEDDYDNQDDDAEAPSPKPPKKKKIKKIRRLLNQTYKKEQNENWEKNFILLKEYKKKHGNTIVPYSAQLGNWVRTQRRYMDNMSIERFNRLNSDLNFTWRCISAKPWMDMYCKFKLYKEEEKEKQEKQKQQHNDDNDDEEIASPSALSLSSSPPSSSLSLPLLCEKDRDLGLWVQAQRFWCKSSKRIILLNEIDFVWDELSEKI